MRGAVVHAIDVHDARDLVDRLSRSFRDFVTQDENGSGDCLLHHDGGESFYFHDSEFLLLGVDDDKTLVFSFGLLVRRECLRLPC